MTERSMESVAAELKQFSDDEGVDALKSKFDKWVGTFEELAELRIPHLSMAFAMIKELHRMCSFNGAFNEVRYVDMTEAEFEAWKLDGPCTKLGASEAGFTLQRGSEFVGWFADDNQYRRIISR
jgi:hypothetical protein